jgi:hypothetical protein
MLADAAEWGRVCHICAGVRLIVSHPGGAIVPEDGVTLPEGSKVTVIADEGERTFEATAVEESELLEAIAGVERGETVIAEDLLERLRR